MSPLAPIVRTLLEQGEPCALVTVADARGSTPREPGARMLVTAARIYGTIGGGRLEFDAMQEARRLLESGVAHALREVPLGPALGQCCGGHATVLIERAGPDDLAWLDVVDGGAPGVLLSRLDAPARSLLHKPQAAPPALKDAAAAVFAERRSRRLRLDHRPEGERALDPPPGGRQSGDWLLEWLGRDLPEVRLFGAGHVGRALAVALAPLPCRVHWIDNRADLLRAPPPGIEAILTRHPADRIDDAAAGTFFLVMTPSHDLDCALCEAVLRRGDFAFLGLIGSATKRARFEKRWRAQGIADERMARLVCPIGIEGIGGKEPAVIAASTVAQLLLAFEARKPSVTSSVSHAEAVA